MTNADKLIPTPETVRLELARASRELTRLRSLLRVAIAARRDREFIETEARRAAQTHSATPPAPHRPEGSAR